MHKLKMLCRLYILGAVLLGASLGMAEPYHNPAYCHENGVRFAHRPRVNEPGFDQKSEAKIAADYFYQTQVYARLPRLLKEKIDANRDNYYFSKKEYVAQKDFIVLYKNDNIMISYQVMKSGFERMNISLKNNPVSLKEVAMATYEPSKPICKKTGKPYFGIPNRILKTLPVSDQAYFNTLLGVMNENYHFLRAYPLLRLDKRVFRDGGYFGKVVPAQYLVSSDRIHRPQDYEKGLKDEIQQYLGVPVYNFDGIRVKYENSTCSAYREQDSDILGRFGFMKYDPDYQLDDLQIRVSVLQVRVLRDSLSKLKAGMEQEYQARQETLSAEGQFVFRKLTQMITQQIDAYEKTLPEKGKITYGLSNLKNYNRFLMRQTKRLDYGAEQKIRTE